MNVFLVTSPFQYICATEAREAYQTKNNLLILVNQDTEAGRKHLSRVFDATSWDHIIEVGRNNRTFVIPKIIKQVKNLVGSGEIEHLFFFRIHVLANTDVPAESVCKKTGFHR